MDEVIEVKEEEEEDQFPEPPPAKLVIPFSDVRVSTTHYNNFHHQLKSWMSITTEIAVIEEENISKEESDANEDLHGLSKLQRDNVELENELVARAHSLDTVVELQRQQVPMDFVLETFVTEAYEKKRDQLCGDTDAMLAKSTEYTEYRKSVWTVHHSGEPLPEEEDDDIAMAVQERSLKCPLTNATFVDPVKSKVCGHTFSKHAIEATIRASRGSSCPIAGCNRPIHLRDLVTDEDTIRDLKRHLRREATMETQPQAGTLDIEEEDEDEL
eukprot:TRINITY_DN9479_c0_g1_i1.p1 TRINITY_DN9479_c0_g1~~TRINITY_DN9479_c0_g1_i1.p1  ORF type:complete len:271 (-),score=68.77 TRINITY_DN9479_c0_g1_i1:83-895(-)